MTHDTTSDEKYATQTCSTVLYPDGRHRERPGVGTRGTRNKQQLIFLSRHAFFSAPAQRRSFTYVCSVFEDPKNNKQISPRRHYIPLTHIRVESRWRAPLESVTPASAGLYLSFEVRKLEREASTYNTFQLAVQDQRMQYGSWQGPTSTYYHNTSTHQQKRIRIRTTEYAAHPRDRRDRTLGDLRGLRRRPPPLASNHVRNPNAKYNHSSLRLITAEFCIFRWMGRGLVPPGRRTTATLEPTRRTRSMRASKCYPRARRTFAPEGESQRAK